MTLKEKIRSASSGFLSRLRGARSHRIYFFSRGSKWKLFFIALVFTGSILTIALAGQVPAQNIYVVNGSQYLTGSYAEAPNATIGYRDNLTSWTLVSSSQNPTAQLNESVGNLSISGTFSPSTSAVSAVIQKSINVNLTEYPIMYAKVNASSGIKYGIRFFSASSNGSLIPIWANQDGLDHRPGLGQFENVQVNLELLALINTGLNASNVSRAQIYVERSPNASALSYSLNLQTIEFLNYSLVPFEANSTSSTYHSVYFSFDGLPNVNSSSWVLNKINFGMSLQQGSPGTAYEIFQLNGTKTIPGSEFEYSPALTSYQYTLYPKNSPRIFPDTLPPGQTQRSSNNASFSIVVVALSGSLSQVKIDSVSFVYLPASPNAVTSSTLPGGSGFWYLYIVFFIFLLPLSVALLLYDEYKHDNLTPGYLALALGVGLICRFALAPMTSQPFDLGIYTTSARGWFEFGDSSTSLGPTLPFTFFLYWIPYSFYGLLLKLGFHDFFILNHQTGVFESIFLKAFPISADVGIFYLLKRFSNLGGGIGKLFAVFYFLNPLSIYISSVWGQYEAATISLVVLGFLYIARQEVSLGSGEQGGIAWGYLKASIAFVVSALIEIVGLIPLIFLFIKSIFSKPFKFYKPLFAIAPVGLIFVFPPEFHLIYLIYLASIGVSSTLLLSQPHTPYTIVSNVPAILPYHPLVICLGGLLVFSLVRRKFDIEHLVLYTFIGFVIFLLFAAQQPQWWVMTLPLGLLYAIVSGKYSLGLYMLMFGSLVAFLILTFTQGSGYILLGSAKYNLAPSIEDIPRGIDLYTVGTTSAILVALGYVFFSRRTGGSDEGGSFFGNLTVIRSSLVLLGVLLVSYFWLSLVGLSL